MSNILMKRKIDLFKKLYKEIAGEGINGDTELAHVNKYEAEVLKAMGGSGTLNNITGLRQYDIFGSDDPPSTPAPTTSTVKQVSDLPEYFKPYAEKLLATAEQVYDEPYEAYEGKRLADVTEEQKMAFAGLQDLFTEVDPVTGERSFKSPMSDEITEAKRLSGRGARGFDELEEGEFQETYMSPYQKAVTDIQTREAKRQQEQARQQRQAAAGAAGALGGSRFGIQEGVAREGDRRLLSDIELKGLQDAYTQGLSVFDADRSAARQGSNQMLGLGQQEQAANLTGLGALQSTGETQRAIAQQPLDVNYEEFVRQKEYPRQSLQELSGILRGFNVSPSTYKTSQVYQQPPTLGSQLLTAGSIGAGISSGLGKSLLGKAGGGLASIAPEKYANGGVSLPINRLTAIKNQSDPFFKRYGRSLPKILPPGITEDNFKVLIEASDDEFDNIKQGLNPTTLSILESYRETIKNEGIRGGEGTRRGEELIEAGEKLTVDRTKPAPDAREERIKKLLDSTALGVNTLPKPSSSLRLGETPEPNAVEFTKPGRNTSDEAKKALEAFTTSLKPNLQDQVRDGIYTVDNAPFISFEDIQLVAESGNMTEIVNAWLESKETHPLYDTFVLMLTGEVTDLKEDLNPAVTAQSRGADKNPDKIENVVNEYITNTGLLTDEIKDTSLLPVEDKSLTEQYTPMSKEEYLKNYTLKEQGAIKTDPETGETVFDFDAALPWLAMAAQFAQPGRGTAESSQAALKEAQNITSAQKKTAREEELLKLKREQLDVDKKYKKALGDKANAYKAIEKLKGTRKLTKEAVDREVKVIEMRLKFVGEMLTKGLNLTGPEREALQKEEAQLKRGLETVLIRYGMPRNKANLSGRMTR